MVGVGDLSPGGCRRLCYLAAVLGSGGTDLKVGHYKGFGENRRGRPQRGTFPRQRSQAHMQRCAKSTG
jgi:hypothetical protein